MKFIRKIQKFIQKIERKCRNENVFLKADKALSKLNFQLESKTNLVTLRKSISPSCKKMCGNSAEFVQRNAQQNFCKIPVKGKI